MTASGQKAPGRLRGWLQRHRLTPRPHTPPPNTPAERRRWLMLMLAGWMTMAGALLAAASLLDNPILLAELAAIIALAFPVAWRMHFSEMPRFWPNYITFFIALILGIIHWRLGLFTGGEADSRLLLSYRALVALFYWVMAFRAFAIRDIRDLTQTALPAISGLLLVLIAAPTALAITGTTIVLAATLAMLAAEHTTRRMEGIDEVIPADRIRGGRWRPRVNSWVSLLLAAAVAASILAGVAARIEPSNPVGQWLRAQLSWRLARLMIGEGSLPYAPGRALELGGPAPDVRDQLMLTMETESPIKVRTAVYDIYRGRSWEQSEREWFRLRLPGGFWELPEPEHFGLSSVVTEPVDVTITPSYAFFGALPVPWCPMQFTLDVPSIRYDRSGMVMFNGHLPPGQTYTATVAAPTAISAPAGTPPPPEVDLEYALQLPETLPLRVRQLTTELVAQTSRRPAEIAITFEGYLRTEHVYDLETPPLPPGEDFVDHFLFESKRGWCNQYASAMVVMLRVAGIPARLATGFTSGEYVASREVFEIRDQDAHAWAEVFLPDTGWIDFDPTPAGDLAGDTTALGILESLGRLGVAVESALLWIRAHLAYAVTVLLLLIAVGVGGRLVTRWYHRRLRPLHPGANPAERAVYAYRRSLQWLAGDGIARPKSAAPWEFHRLAAGARPALGSDLALLTEAYTRARFSPSAPDERVVSEAEAALARVRETIFSPQPDERADADE
ncbi:MAG: DUF4129 domain-containing transglutaminase family protein [Armatimonadota bacterium]|jgi:transglutaminase-like putative cysteine protease